MAKEYSQMSASDITGIREGGEAAQPTISRGETFKRIIGLLKPNAAFVVFSILLAAVSVAGTLYVPVLSGRGVDMILGPGNVDFPGVIRICIVFAIATAVAGAAQWLMALVNNRIT